jgi:DNA-binding transcriptional regulator LsrR (DeoR family)
MHGEMKQMTSEMKQQQLEWRRAQVLELASEGYSQREIAHKLQVDLAAVNRDIQFLRQQAQENLQHHIHEVVPEEYQKCMIGMKRNLKQTLEIAEGVTDPRVKLEARRIANDCYRYIMDLTTNGVVVTDAMKYVQGKMEHLNNQKKEPLQGIQDQKDKTETENVGQQKTTNGIF